MDNREVFNMWNSEDKWVNYHDVSKVKPTACQNALPTLSQDYSREEFEFQRAVNNSLKVWQCQKCDFSSTDFAQFKRHKLQHDAQLMRCYCFYCNHVCYSKEELSCHVEKHTRLFPFKCPYCNYAAEQEGYVVTHLKQKHNAPPNIRPIPQVSVKLPTALPREPRTMMPPTYHIPPVTTNPMITPQPGVTQNPRLTQNPGVTPNPRITHNPGVTPNPRITPQPGATQNPRITQNPGVTPNPGPTQHPRVTPNPRITQNPGVTPNPRITPQPGATQNVRITPHPGTTQNPRITHNPGVTPNVRITPQPGVSQNPRITLNPGVTPNVRITPQPGVTPNPRPTQHPGVTSNPRITPQPGVTPNPRITQNPGVTANLGPTQHPRVTPHPGVAPNPRITPHPGVPPNPRLTQNPGVTPNLRITQHPGVTPNPHVTPNPGVTLLRTRNIMTRVGEEGHRLMTVTNANMLPKHQMELLAPLNEPLQYNMPLTVSFPEEVSLPPGCLVELVEVKTVNGTKELKLRIVPPEPSGSPVKDSSSTTSQNATSGTVSSRSVSDLATHRLKLMSELTRTADRLAQAGIKLNQKCLPTTTPSTDSVQVINAHESKRVTVKDEPKEDGVKTKDSAGQPLEGTSTEVKEEDLVQKPVSPGPNVSVTVRCPSSPVVCKEESPCVLPSKSFHLSDPKTSVWVQADGWNERSVECEGPEFRSFPVISSVFSLSQPPDGGCPSTLMVALRRMPTDIEDAVDAHSSGGVSSIRRPVVLDKRTAVLTGHDENVKAAESENVPTKNVSTILKPLLTPQLCNQSDSENTVTSTQHTQTLTENVLNFKTERPRITIKVKIPALKNGCKRRTENVVPASVQQEATPKNTPHTNGLVAECVTDSAPSCAANHPDVPTRLSFCPTVSLKRFRAEDDGEALNPQVHRQECSSTPAINGRKKRKKQHKAHRRKTLARVRGTMTVLRPTPLKDDQPVKQPGPNQPVVVLNHPKPKALRRLPGARALAHTPASQEVVPKCDIMKMRLSKVMGEKYVVVGWTVRATP